MGFRNREEFKFLDFDKFADALRLKANLSREINFLDSKWEKSFYGIYRERVWNGSLGESEIYSGYGSKLKKQILGLLMV